MKPQFISLLAPFLLFFSITYSSHKPAFFCFKEKHNSNFFDENINQKNEYLYNVTTKPEILENYINRLSENHFGESASPLNFLLNEIKDSCQNGALGAIKYSVGVYAAHRAYEALINQNINSHENSMRIATSALPWLLGVGFIYHAFTNRNKTEENIKHLVSLYEITIFQSPKDAIDYLNQNKKTSLYPLFKEKIDQKIQNIEKLAKEGISYDQKIHAYILDEIPCRNARPQDI